MWAAYGIVLALIVVAALFDWQARRQGRTQRTSTEYWYAVREARREAGREARARWFGRRR